MHPKLDSHCLPCSLGCKPIVPLVSVNTKFSIEWYIRQWVLCSPSSPGFHIQLFIIFFVVYINDLPEVHWKTAGFMHADDTVVLRSHPSLTNMSNTQFRPAQYLQMATSRPSLSEHWWITLSRFLFCSQSLHNPSKFSFPSMNLSCRWWCGYRAPALFKESLMSSRVKSNTSDTATMVKLSFNVQTLV